MKSQGLQIPVGNTITVARVGGKLYNGTVNINSNTNITAVVLDSFTLKANSLNTIGQKIEVIMSGTVALNALASTTLAVNVGTVQISSLAGFVSQDFVIRLLLVVSTTGASGVLKFIIEFEYFGIPVGTATIVTEIGSKTVDLTIDNVVKLISTTTGGTGTNYVTEFMMLADYVPEL